MSNKPRSDAKLLNLPPEQQAQLAEWLLSGVPYHRAREMVHKDFQVLASLTAFSDFWHAVCAPELLKRRSRAVATSEYVAEEAAKNPGQFDAATIDALKQKAFELAISPGADPKAVKNIFALVLKARDQDAEMARLKLDRDKFAQQTCELFLRWFSDKKAADIANSNLSNADKIAALRQTYFADVEALQASGSVVIPT